MECTLDIPDAFLTAQIIVLQLHCLHPEITKAT
jgi:hypothetical protein